MTSGLNWGSGLYRSSELKMRSLWWSLIQCAWCPHKKGTFGDRRACRENNTGDREDGHPSPSRDRDSGRAFPQSLGEPALVTLDL